MKNLLRIFAFVFAAALASSMATPLLAQQDQNRDRDDQKVQDQDRDQNQNKDRDKDRDKDRAKNKDRDRDQDRAQDRDRDRDQNAAQDRDRNRGDRDQNAVQDQDRDHDRTAVQSSDRDRDRMSGDESAFFGNPFFKQGWQDGLRHKHSPRNFRNDDDRRAYEAGFAHGERGEQWHNPGRGDEDRR